METSPCGERCSFVPDAQSAKHSVAAAAASTAVREVQKSMVRSFCARVAATKVCEKGGVSKRGRPDLQNTGKKQTVGFFCERNPFQPEMIILLLCSYDWGKREKGSRVE